jgi:hypothetical protein
MEELRDLWRDVTIELQTLRALFPASERGVRSRELFDEFLSEKELGLASPGLLARLNACTPKWKSLTFA